MGCDEGSEQAATPPPSPQTAAGPALPRIKWLNAHSEVTPEQWLASRAAHADLTEADPEVQAIRAELYTAAKRFGNEPRMVANRAVQLEEMLSAEGIDESAPDLIAFLNSMASDTRPKEGFGTVCQHYFNLRKQGVGRDAALERLKDTSFLGPDVSLHRG